MRDWRLITGVIGFILTVSIGFVISYWLNSGWAFVLAFIPYNIYEFIRWRKWNTRKERKETYNAVLFLFSIPVIIALVMLGLGRY